MRKIFTFIFLIILIFCFTFFFHLNKSLAINCDLNINLSQLSEADLQALINQCQQKVSDLRSQINSLSSQIQYMDTQIYLTTLKIKETEEKIDKTEKEIELLGERIEGLDKSLDYLSQLLLIKIIKGYKSRQATLLNLILDSGNFSDLVSRIKYLKATQENNQKLLIQVQRTKLNFEEQKKLREEKMVELDNLKKILNSQKIDLENQQKAKKNLLVATQNDEQVYQNLLDKARRELAGFSAFVQAAGGGLTSFGNGSNGWYYTQRDPQWGNMLLPGSSYSLLLAGCAVTSVAMVCRSYGQAITPATIVSDPSRFIGGDLWNWAFSCSGKTTEWVGNSYDRVKEIVKDNKPVILRLVAPSVSGLHFIVAYGWDEGKNDFKIHDPYYGPDKLFSERYSWGQVTTAIFIH
jgi:peptidoglycan hydrolase CwlO-like protein